jgi:hypothetical protein
MVEPSECQVCVQSRLACQVSRQLCQIDKSAYSVDRVTGSAQHYTAVRLLLVYKQMLKLQSMAN